MTSSQLAENFHCWLQDQFLQLLDGVSKLFSSPQGLSAAIYTQVSDVEAEVNGELGFFTLQHVEAQSACSIIFQTFPVCQSELQLQTRALICMEKVAIDELDTANQKEELSECQCLCRAHDI